MTYDDLIVAVAAIVSAILLYPKLREGIVAIKNDIEALIREIRNRLE